MNYNRYELTIIDNHQPDHEPTSLTFHSKKSTAFSAARSQLTGPSRQHHHAIIFDRYAPRGKHNTWTIHPTFQPLPAA